MPKTREDSAAPAEDDKVDATTSGTNTAVEATPAQLEVERIIKAAKSEGSITAADLAEKVSTLDPTAGDPWDILTMATIEGARLLGLADITGSLESGKRADIVTVDLRGLHTTPLLHGPDFNAAAHLVFSASGHDVRDVWVDGRRLVAQSEVQSVDIEEVGVHAQAAAEELFERRSALPRRTLDG